MQYISLAFALAQNFVRFLTPYRTGLMSYCAADLLSTGVDILQITSCYSSSDIA